MAREYLVHLWSALLAPLFSLNVVGCDGPCSDSTRSGLDHKKRLSELNEVQMEQLCDGVHNDPELIGPTCSVQAALYAASLGSDVIVFRNICDEAEQRCLSQDLECNGPDALSPDCLATVCDYETCNELLLAREDVLNCNSTPEEVRREMESETYKTQVCQRVESCIAD